MPHPTWGFLSTYGLVFLAVANDPSATQREIAGQVGVTERTVQTVLRDLLDAGYVVRFRDGRRNRYEIDDTAPMRHPLLQPAARVEDLLRLVAES